jgi:hypothetical protein
MYPSHHEVVRVAYLCIISLFCSIHLSCLSKKIRTNHGGWKSGPGAHGGAKLGRSFAKRCSITISPCALPLQCWYTPVIASVTFGILLTSFNVLTSSAIPGVGDTASFLGVVRLSRNRPANVSTDRSNLSRIMNKRRESTSDTMDEPEEEYCGPNTAERPKLRGVRAELE